MTASFGDIELADGVIAEPDDSPSARMAAAEAPTRARPAPSASDSEASFGDLDLPAPAPSPGGIAAFRPAPPQAPPAPRGFGDIDLPARPDASSGSDLPARAFGASAGSPRAGAAQPRQGRADLPTPSAGLPARAPSGPRGRVATRAFGDIDLPIVGGADLPAPSGGVGLPAAGGGVGLPSPGGGVGLPSPGGAGLPSAYGGGLPDVAPTGLPIVGGPGLPRAQSAGLPQAVGGVGLPGSIVGAELYEGTSLDEEEPLYDDGDDGPVEEDPPDEDLDGPEIGEELSLGLSANTARAALASAAHVAPPPAHDPTPPPRAETAIAHGSGFDVLGDASAPYTGGEIGGLESQRPPAAAVPEAPTSEAAVGGEAEIGGGTEGDSAAPIAQAPAARAPEPVAPKKKSNVGRYVVAALVLSAIGGGSLALVPDIGPFGINAISDRINAADNEAALVALRAAVDKELAVDTAAAATRALGVGRLAHEAAPRYRPTAAYTAYVAFSRGLRFGRRNEDEAYGKQLLEQVGPEAASDPALALAMAAQDAVSGQLARARQAVTTLGKSAPNDVDVAALAGEIELAAKAPDKAMAAWEHAVTIEKSARTLYGLARAAQASGDLKAAETAAKEALALSEKHAGARTLLALIAWQQQGHDDDALKLLKEVTESDAVRAAASEAEMVDAFTLLGRVHLARSRMSAAEDAFAAALKLSPQAVQALVGNGELFYRSGRFSEALSRFEAAIRADADNVVAKVGAAKTWLSLERMKEAKDLLKKLREAYPADPLVAYWLGRTEDALGNKKDAEAAFLDAIKVGGEKPEVIDAYVSLTHLLSGLGRMEEAGTKLTEASEKFPKSAELHRAKGEVWLQTGRYEDAKNELLAALTQDDDLGTRFKLGIAQRRMRSFEDAATTFDKVAEIDKDYPGLALERGLLFEQTGQTDRALEMYNEALRKAPNDVDMMLRVGSTQVMAGHATQAEPILREVLKQRPKSAEAYHFLGRALLVRGTNLAEAMKYLEQATAIDPNRAEYFLYVGWGANEAGQPSKASSALERALELDRELGDAYWQRGVLLQKQGATLDALSDLRTALEKRPSRYEAYATMALCYQDQGKWGDAEQAWRKAIEADDTVSEWHYRLGKIYSNRNNQSGAATELGKALTLTQDPTRTHTPAWVFDAHFLYAEAMRAAGNREKAIEHYRRFLETAPTDNAYRVDAEKQLDAYGARSP